MEGSWNDWVELLCSGYKCTHHILVNCLIVCFFTAWGTKGFVNCCHMHSKKLVLVFISLVKKQENQVETGEKGLWKIDIFLR